MTAQRRNPRGSRRWLQRGVRRHICCAKLIENEVRYADQNGTVQRIPLATGSHAKACRVLAILVPDVDWLVVTG